MPWSPAYSAYQWHVNNIKNITYNKKNKNNKNNNITKNNKNNKTCSMSLFHKGAVWCHVTSACAINLSTILKCVESQRWPWRTEQTPHSTTIVPASVGMEPTRCKCIHRAKHLVLCCPDHWTKSLSIVGCVTAHCTDYWTQMNNNQHQNCGR